MDNVFNFVSCLFFLVTCGLITSGEVTGNKTLTQHDIVDKLLQNYDNRLTPSELSGKATVVQLGVFMLTASIDGQTKTATCVLYFRQRWIDHRLQFDPTLSDADSLDVEEWSRVWRPDTFFRYQTVPTSTDHQMMKLFRSGTVLFSQRIFLTTPLHVDSKNPTRFSLHLSIESFAKKMDVLQLIPFPNYSVDMDIGAMSSIEYTTTVDCTQNYTIGAFPCLDIELHLRPTGGQDLLQYIALPSILVVVVSWTAFWLSPSTTACIVSRVLIGLITVMMSLIVAYFHYGSSRISVMVTTATNILIGGSVGIILLAFLESIIAIVLASGESTETKVTVNDWIPLSSEGQVTESSNISSIPASSTNQMSNDHNTSRGRFTCDDRRRVDFVAKIAFPVVYVIICTTAIIVANA